MAKTSPETRTESEPWTIQEIPLDLIDQGEQLIRHDPLDEDVVDLAMDIQRNGLMQPIGVTPTDASRYQLRWGGRRLAAHRHLRRATIPARITYANPDQIRSTAIRENVLRRQLTLEEECDAVLTLAEVERLSPEEISSHLSRSRAWVLRRMAIPQLPIELRESLLHGRISLGAAEIIALLEDPGARAYALQQCRATDLTIPEIRTLVQALQAAPNQDEAVDAGVAVAIANQQPNTIHLACNACGRVRPIAEIAVVRVCADGCTTAEEQEAQAHAQRH